MGKRGGGKEGHHPTKFKKNGEDDNTTGCALTNLRLHKVVNCASPSNRWLTALINRGARHEEHILLRFQLQLAAVFFLFRAGVYFQPRAPEEAVTSERTPWITIFFSLFEDVAYQYHLRVCPGLRESKYGRVFVHLTAN